MECLGLISKSEEGDKLREKARQHEELADLEDRKQAIREQLEAKQWVSTLPVMSDYEAAMSISKKYNLNITEAKAKLDVFPKQYMINDKTIPDIVKELKKHRRSLKGEEKINFTKGIDNLIVQYGNHLSNCIKSIYWLSPYETPLRNMRYTENDLKKLHSIKDVDTRREVIDVLCKFWEADLHRGNTYDSEYSSLTKTMTNAKKEFRKIVTEIPSQVIKYNISKQLDDNILKQVCDNPSIYIFN